MSKIDKIKKYIKQPYKIKGYLGLHGYFKNMEDEKYLKMIYKSAFNKELDLENPKTFNEKMQWLKLNDRKDIYTTMVDKYEVKKYVSDIIGEEYVIPTLGIWNNFDEINFEQLPNQFVLKCTHDSGGLVICKDKSKLDIKKAKKIINKCLKQNYYYKTREWPYKNVKPRIIAEQFVEDNNDKELRDYKFFCFNGEPKLMFIASGRQNPNSETCFDFYDMDFNHLNILNGHPMAKIEIHKPINFEKMKELSRTLSQNIPILRVDFYEVNGKILFGELTFSHWGGIIPFEPEEWDYKIGEWIEIKK